MQILYFLLLVDSRIKNYNFVMQKELSVPVTDHRNLIPNVTLEAEVQERTKHW